MPIKEEYQLKLGNTADYVFDFESLHYIEMDEKIKSITGLSAAHFKKEIVFHSLVQLMDVAHVDAIYEFIQLVLQQFKKRKYRKDITVNIIYDMNTSEGNRRILDQFRLFKSKSDAGILSVGRFTDISHIEKTGLPQIFILEGNRVVFEKKADSVKLAKEETLPLTETELRILKLSSKGFSPIEIAKKMKLTVATIYSHRKNIKQKMKMEFVAVVNLLRKKEII